MKRFFAKRWVRICLLHAGIFAGTAAVVALTSLMFGGACMTYELFGICCPFCGMTRAHLAALRLDFAAAFAYHPAFFTALPLLFLCFHKALFKTRWQSILWWVLTVALGAVLLGTYVARVILSGGFDFFA